jgi:hypothetical protein
VSMMMVPAGWRVWDVQDLRSGRGVGEGRKRVCGGADGRAGMGFADDED